MTEITALFHGKERTSRSVFTKFTASLFDTTRGGSGLDACNKQNKVVENLSLMGNRECLVVTSQGQGRAPGILAELTIPPG
jgi:hypothetical protein